MYITGDDDRILKTFPMAASSRTIGHMQAFDAANESDTAYLERFQLFVNSIEDDKLVPTSSDQLTTLSFEGSSALKCQKT